MVPTHSPTLHTAQRAGFAQTLARPSTCMLALQIAHLMRRQAERAGLHLSVRQLLDQLAGIAETVLIFPSTGGRPKARRVLTETTHSQDKLIEIFDLTRWAPRT
jgi:RNA polymerase-interacting CarD/CdnL/TRCF family regulator